MLEFAAGPWVRNGYDIEFVDDWRKATVTIDIDENLKHRGDTHLWMTAPGGEIKYATITVRDNDPLVYVHEFGHMFGIKHKLSPSGIVMNPNRPGWDERGIERRGETNSRGRDP